MFRITFVLAALLLFCGATPAAWAQPYSEALVALQFAEGSLYRRTAQIEWVLKTGYRFTRVRIVTDADADALSSLIRKFVAQPAVTGERRFVWVSGSTGRRAGEPCPPDIEGRAAKPRTALMMVAPACFRHLIDLPPGIRHSIFAPGWIDPSLDPKPVNTTLSAQTFAFVALPDDHQKPAEVADGAVLDRIAQGLGRTISAYVLFETLRRRLRVDGSDFTPYLEVSKPEAAWATNLFGGNPAKLDFKTADSRRPDPPAPKKYVSVPELQLHRAPDITAEAHTIPTGDAPIAIIRKDVSGTMAYVETADGRYGWIQRDFLRMGQPAVGHDDAVR